MALFRCGDALAEKIVLIAHQNSTISAISNQDAANIFLGIGGNDLTPYDQKDRNLRASFYKSVAGLSLASVRAHWAKRVFTGRGRPPAIIDYKQSQLVFKDPSDAITYIPATQQIAGTKVLLTLDTGE